MGPSNIGRKFDECLDFNTHWVGPSNIGRKFDECLDFSTLGGSIKYWNEV